MFDRYMSAIPSWSPQVVASAYDFSAKRLLVDVAGGLGSLLGAILEERAGVRGVLFDRPEVIACAAFSSDIADRVECVSGDMFHSVPAGGDVYILSNIIHHCDDTQSSVILQNCRRAMSDGSVPLICEQVLPEENAFPAALRTDVMMLALTGGPQRMESEFRPLLERAKLQLNKVVRRPALAALIEALPT